MRCGSPKNSALLSQRTALLVAGGGSRGRRRDGSQSIVRFVGATARRLADDIAKSDSNIAIRTGPIQTVLHSLLPNEPEGPDEMLPEAAAAPQPRSVKQRIVALKE